MKDEWKDNSHHKSVCDSSHETGSLHELLAGIVTIRVFEEKGNTFALPEAVCRSTSSYLRQVQGEVIHD